jgi:hypothetical protein
MGLKKATIKLGADIGEFTSKMRKASSSFKKMGKNIQKAGKTMSMSLTAPLTAFAAASIKAFDQQAKAEAKLMTALKGNEKAFKSLTKQAQELQKVTIFGDEETMAAQSMLASMGLNEEAIKRLTPLIQDMATAKGMNLTAAADLVAKSVGSSTNALSRYGIQIEGAVGSTDRLDSAVLALKGQFEGQAKAAAKAGAGPLKQLSNRFGDLMEKIGEMLIPILNKLVSGLDTMITTWNNLDEGIKIAVVTFGTLLASIGPLVYIFGSLVSVVGFFMSPLGAVVAGLAALSAAAIYVVDNMEAFKERFSDVGWWKNALIQMIQWFIEYNPYSLITKGFNKVLEYFGRDPIGNIFESMSDSLEGLKVETKDYKNEFGSFGDAISNAATKAKDALFGMGSAMGIGTGAAKSEYTGQAAGVSFGAVTLDEMDVDEFEEQAEVIDTTYGDMLIKLGELKEATKQFGLSIANDLAGSMANAVVSGENFLVSMGNIFKDLAKQIAAMLIKAALLAAVFSMIPGLGAAQAAGGGATSFSGLLTGMMGGIPGRANGGFVAANKPYVVGERGPELFMSSSSGSIIPNHELGGGSVIPDVRISGDDLLIIFDKANRRKARR